MPNLPDPMNKGNAPGQGPLRSGGVAVTQPLTADDLPSQRSPLSEKQQQVTKMCRDFMGGTQQVHDGSFDYLPKAPGEEPVDYNTRLGRSMWHNFYRRTVMGLVGLIFRKDPVLGEDVPQAIREHWENIDLAGTHGDVFLRQVEEDAMAVGHCAVLVEYPNVGGQKLNRAQEAPLRPYWVPIRKEDIISWRTTVEAGKLVLTQLVLRERSYVAKGRFSEKEQTRYRIFIRDEAGVRFELVEVTDANKIHLVDEGPYTNQTEIPVVEVPTAGKLGLFESNPPMLDIAWLNLAHYQANSDYMLAVHKCNVPLLFGAGITTGRNADGVPQGPVVIGANTFIRSDNPQAKLVYVSHDGAQLESTRQVLEDLKSDIGTLGLSMLAPQKRTAETAQAKRIDKSQSDSALSVSARALQDAAEQLLQFHGNYMKLPGGSITINRDFEGMIMDPAAMQAFASLIREGYPVMPALKSLQAGGRIPDDEDLEALEMEWLMGQAATADQRAQDEAQARMGQLQVVE